MLYRALNFDVAGPEIQMLGLACWPLAWKLTSKLPPGLVDSKATSTSTHTLPSSLCEYFLCYLRSDSIGSVLKFCTQFVHRRVVFCPHPLVNMPSATGQNWEKYNKNFADDEEPEKKITPLTDECVLQRNSGAGMAANDLKGISKSSKPMARLPTQQL